MSNSYSILGQVDLTTNALTDVYTVPSGKQAVISSIILANRTGSATSFKIALRPQGNSVTNAMYIAYNIPLSASDSTTLNLGLTLNASDVISVEAATENAVSVNISGTEITN